MADMTVTNQTAVDYWFGPLHLPAGVGQTLVVDITTNASLYLTSDAVADSLNNLYAAGKITVSSPPVPFPRPTGVPLLFHGDGSPEGSVFAPQGSPYLRRDNGGGSNAVYVKTTGVTISTGWVALAAATPTPAGTNFPGSPSDGDEYVYIADATNGVYWRFKWSATNSYWAFIGGPPLYSEVQTQEITTSTTYAALTTSGPSVTLPFAADYMVLLGAIAIASVNDSALMSYDIGGTGAIDADAAEVIADPASQIGMSVSRLRRKAGLGAVTLTAKYKSTSGANAAFASRFVAVTPVKR